MPTIARLYPSIELYSEGDPALNTLFVLGHTQSGPPGIEEMLLVDPPEDVARRFRLPERSAAAFTGAPVDTGLPAVAHSDDGERHVRFGEKLVDLYFHEHGALILLPELGILCCGMMGSDVLPPVVGPGSDGQAELDALRIAARLMRTSGVQLLIPRCGEPVSGRPAIGERLANDVAYLHGLRRTLLPLRAHPPEVEDVKGLAAALLPEPWTTSYARQVHAANVRSMLQ